MASWANNRMLGEDDIANRRGGAVVKISVSSKTKNKKGECVWGG